MNAFLLLTGTEGGGQIEQIASTFGVDWPHLIAQVISFSIVCILLYLFAYKPILKMLTTRRELIAQGLANSEQIKAELAQTEVQRQEVLARADIEATQFIEEARTAAARLREQETQKAMTAAEQIMEKARAAAASDHTQNAQPTQTRSGPAGRANHRGNHRQGSNNRRSTTPGRGNGEGVEDAAIAGHFHEKPQANQARGEASVSFVSRQSLSE